MTEILLGFRSILYEYGALFIQYLQSAHPRLGDWLVPVSALGDPSKGFTVIFPLILAINYQKGVKFLGTFIMCEWFNMVSAGHLTSKIHN